MKTVLTLAVLLVSAAAPAELWGQDPHHHHPPSNRIGLMSPEVVQRRMELLGYRDVRVLEVTPEHVRVQAVKDGRPAVLEAGRRIGPRKEMELRPVDPARLNRPRPELRRPIPRTRQP